MSKLSKDLVSKLVLGLVSVFIFTGCEMPGVEEEGVVDAHYEEEFGTDVNLLTALNGEPVVLVHGNAGYPSDWDDTVDTLENAGYTSYYIIRPNWGSKSCPACNDHTSGELNPVKSALQTAISRSSTGKIDVVGHSMGVTLAAKAILDLGIADKVRSFVSIAGALRGLNSCGVYPWNVWTTTCGRNGLSIGSPFLNSIKNKRFGQYHYAFYSWSDQVVCLGSCLVYGQHSSKIWLSNGNTSFALGHFGLKDYTTNTQLDRIATP